MNNKPIWTIVVVVAALLLAAVALPGSNLSAGSQAAPSMKLVETVQENGNFTKLVDALNSTGLSDTLNGTGPYTVFAPTDAAFQAFVGTGGANGSSDGENMTKVLQFHVVSGEITPSMLRENAVLKTIEGKELVVFKNQTGTYISGAKVTAAAINASNGIIYSIDKVLVPRTVLQVIENQSSLSSLSTAITDLNMTKSLNSSGPYTVFAPNNAAFDDLNSTMKALLTSNNTTEQAMAAQLLNYHVVPKRVLLGNSTDNMTLMAANGERLVILVNGDEVTVNGAKVVEANLIATNGVVHVIDEFLTPPMSIVDTAKAKGLTKFAAAVESANLTDDLNKTGPFTVFAPNDAAFDALGSNTSMDQANLSEVLLYHVIKGEVFSWELKNGTVTTMNGQKVNITKVMTTSNSTADGNATGTSNQTIWKVGDATIITTDILCTNGVIHVIDKVLIPPSMSPSAPGTPEQPSNPTSPSSPSEPTCG